MINAILFDLDGTLLNTLEDLRDATNYAITSFGFPEVTTEDIRKNIGNGILNLIKRCVNFQLEHIDEMHQAFKEYYYKNCNVHTVPYDGIQDILIYIKGKGIKLGVITNKVYPAAKTLIKGHFGDTFDIILGDQMDLNLARKPKPDMISYASEQLGIPLDEILYIGDSDVDVETVKNAKVNGMFVSYGYRDYEKLKEFTPDIVKDTKALYDYIKTIL